MSEYLDCEGCDYGANYMPRRPLDPCITSLVLALNAAGFVTEASCCGHGVRPANIVLRDGRELIVCRDWEDARKTDSLWPPIHGTGKKEGA